jgi:hypothetical protein
MALSHVWRTVTGPVWAFLRRECGLASGLIQRLQQDLGSLVGCATPKTLSKALSIKRTFAGVFALIGCV